MSMSTGLHFHRKEETSHVNVTFSCVIDAECCRPVNDDALQRHTKALVQASQTIGSKDLHQAVPQTAELSLTWSHSHISSQTGTSKIQRVHKTEGGGPGGAARRQVAGEVPPELGTLVNAFEKKVPVSVLESKV